MERQLGLTVLERLLGVHGLRQQLLFCGHWDFKSNDGTWYNDILYCLVLFEARQVSIERGRFIVLTALLVELDILIRILIQKRFVHSVIGLRERAPFPVLVEVRRCVHRAFELFIVVEEHAVLQVSHLSCLVL